MADILDIFNGDAFSTSELTLGVQRNPFQPIGLGALDIFTPDPIRTTSLSIEERTGQLVLIPFSERGAEGKQRTTEKRKMRHFNVPRLMHDDTLYSSELQNVRAFQEGQSQVSVFTQVQDEIARRLSGPTGLLASVEYTKEYMRLAAVQGLCLDPGTNDVLYNWFDEFGISQAAPIAFNLAGVNTANSIRPICNSIVRTIARKAQGAFPAGTKVYALCGDVFYDEFVNHPDVIRTFLNWSDAAQLRNNAQGAAFDSFEFAGIVFMNYRGSDDNSTVKIPANEVKFFPDAPGIFREVMAPGETMDWVNTPGKPVYVLPIPDLQRRMWWKMEAYSYPLMICTRPEVLLSGVA